MEDLYGFGMLAAVVAWLLYDDWKRRRDEERRCKDLVDRVEWHFDRMARDAALRDRFHETAHDLDCVDDTDDTDDKNVKAGVRGPQ